MRRTPGLTSLTMLVVLLLGASFAAADWIEKKKEFEQYGQVQNSEEVFDDPHHTGFKGCCAAASTINSFVYLQTHYKDHYSRYGNLVESNHEAAAYKLAWGWTSLSGEKRDGMYGDKATAKNVWAHKCYWLEDWSPRSTFYYGQWYDSTVGWHKAFGSSPLQGNTYPTWDFLWNSLVRCEDIELVIYYDTTAAHCVNLWGMKFEDKNGVEGWQPAEDGDLIIWYQDPNKPDKDDLTTKLNYQNNRFSFLEGDWKDWTIRGAFVESPTPEPATAFLLLLGAPVVAWARRRRKES